MTHDQEAMFHHLFLTLFSCRVAFSSLPRRIRGMPRANPARLQEEVLAQLKAQTERSRRAPRTSITSSKRRSFAIYLSQKDLPNAIIHMQRSIDLQDEPDVSGVPGSRSIPVSRKSATRNPSPCLTKAQEKFPDSMDIAYSS